MDAQIWHPPFPVFAGSTYYISSVARKVGYKFWEEGNSKKKKKEETETKLRG